MIEPTPSRATQPIGASIATAPLPEAPRSGLPRMRRHGLVVLLVLCGAPIVVLGLSAAHSVREPGRTRDKAVHLIADPESMDRLGQVCLEQGDPDGARRWWRLSAESDPHRAAPWLQLGRLALLRKEPGEAVNPLDRALAINPDCYQALHGLVVAHRLLGHEAEARDFQARAVRAQRALPPPTGGMGADAPPVPRDRLP